MNTPTSQATLPPGLKNAYLFATFNAFSFQIVLGSPMVLYAKSLGAGATVLGILAGMTPLLVIFQIPAAQYIGRVGYKRFVYSGWGIRVMFIFGMALVPITSGFLDAGTRLALMLMLLFCFNLSRGISSAGWLPWITSLVPATIRGRYLAWEAAWVNLASFVTFLLSAWCLGVNPRPGQFALSFLFSACMGAASLVFLKRIPEAEAPDQVRASTSPVPWLEMIRFPPFWKLLRMVAAWSIAYGGLTVFTVVFLKVRVGMAEGQILLLNSVFFVGGFTSVWFLGSRLDRLGSKPVLTFALVIWLLLVSGWALLAGQVWRASVPLVLVLQFLMGLFAALVTMSNTRLVMVIVPVMGRSHFFALFSVLGSLALGLAPILWGLVIDMIGSWERLELGLSWNNYSIFFVLVVLALLLALLLTHRLEEPQAASLEDLVREILIQSPQRAWTRLWLRE